MPIFAYYAQLLNSQFCRGCAAVNSVCVVFTSEKLREFSESGDQNVPDDFSRKLLFSDKRFYLLAFNTVVVPFLATGLFFYQSALAEYKNWDIK